MTPYTIKVEYAHERRIRERNKFWYRVAHWPIWIWVFFLAPGPLTFELFAHGPTGNNLIWLIIVLAGTGIAGTAGKLPGVETKPYILRFCEDKPNPLYRRICYTFGWNALLNFAALNLAGLIMAVATGKWVLKQIYTYAYFPVLLTILAGGFFAVWPRVKRSTAGEGVERRYFYGTVWTVVTAQIVIFAMWKTLPRKPSTDVLELCVYTLVLAVVGSGAMFGWLPRTRPIVAGEVIVGD